MNVLPDTESHMGSPVGQSNSPIHRCNLTQMGDDNINAGGTRMAEIHMNPVAPLFSDMTLVKNSNINSGTVVSRKRNKVYLIGYLSSKTLLICREGH